MIAGTRQAKVMGFVSLLASIAFYVHFLPDPCDGQDAIPPDLRIVAEYGPGLADWKWWDTTVEPNGRATQEASGGGTRSMMLSPESMRRLVRAIDKEKFFDIEEEHDGGVEDHESLVLSVTMRKKTRKVMVYAPDRLRTKPEVARFLRVWYAVLEAVPSPNPDQRPGQYEKDGIVDR
jgi:hypothetical protein